MIRYTRIAAIGGLIILAMMILRLMAIGVSKFIYARYGSDGLLMFINVYLLIMVGIVLSIGWVVFYSWKGNRK